MKCYDVFNGDADGICALVQLRLAEPRTAHLITGVKRDINLLERVDANKGDHVTALDISMRTNADGLRRVLTRGASVFYADHHGRGEMPRHENLFEVIDTRPNICTALLVDVCLEGAFREWAVVAAFGDNLADAAKNAAQTLSTTNDELCILKSLGELMNYNAYGAELSDLHFTPQDLYARCVAFASPREFLSADPAVFQILQEGYASDMAKARACGFVALGVTILEDAPWARRVSGSYGNVLAVENPVQAHAVLTHNSKDGYLISVRAPKENPFGAEQLCLKFPTGGGRAAAAGINHLPKDELDGFLEVFGTAF